MKKNKDLKEIKPIIKLNGGNPICLCNNCKKIITMGLLYCNECKEAELKKKE